MGRCDGGRDERQLEMAHNARHHRRMDADDNEPEQATVAKGTYGHMQATDLSS
jgi:hypothetical protein